MTSQTGGLTYAEVQATQSQQLPAGYRHVQRRVEVGTGEAVFTAVATAMQAWGIHQQAGLAVRASATSPQVGTNFSAGLSVLGMARLWIPCRVVWRSHEQTCYGYGFGTVRGHPFAGEEAFVVSQADDGAVWFSVRAFSRPASRLMRLGAVVTDRVQDRITDRYVAAALRLARH